MTEGLRVDPKVIPLFTRIAPGVRGKAKLYGDELWVPLIIAEVPGSGAVGAYLDRLIEVWTVVVPTVVSARLEAMLRRRGFIEERRTEPGQTVESVCFVHYPGG